MASCRQSKADTLSDIDIFVHCLDWTQIYEKVSWSLCLRRDLEIYGVLAITWMKNSQRRIPKEIFGWYENDETKTVNRFIWIFGGNQS
jgi:hypothetical protein